MSFLRRLFSRQPRANSNFGADVEHHLALCAQDLETQGHSAQEARQALGLRLLDELRAALRYAFRGIRQSPGFTFISVSVLALALAANIAFFTLYDNYVLKPLPIRAPDRNYDLNGVTVQGRRNNYWSMEEYEKLRLAARDTFEALYSESTWQVPLSAPLVGSAFVTGISGPYFNLHALSRPALGQYLDSNNPRPEIVLSDSGWRRLFHADPRVIGRTMRVRQTLFTVIGVAPPAFVGTEPIVPDFWASIQWNTALRPDFNPAAAGANLSGILREDVSPSRAAAVLNGAAIHFPRETDRKLDRLELVPRSAIVPPEEESQIAAALIFTAFLLVLAIACANLANLHLARAAVRAPEIAIRLSLGAGRRRLLRQLLTESIVLSLLGATVGLGAAFYGMDLLQNYLFSAVLPVGITPTPISLSFRIFLATAIVGILAGIAFGLLPALEATKPNLVPSRTRSSRKRSVLIVAQATASLVLLILAGILVRNTQRLHGADPGFPLDQIVDSNIEKSKPQDRNRLISLPGIATASVLSRIPLSGWSQRTPVQVDGRAEQLVISYADENYLSLLQLSPLQGRNFTAAEAEHRANVALISAATARLLWPGEGSVLGKTIVFPEGGDTKPRTMEVIGVIPDIIGGLYFQGLDRSAVILPTAPGQSEAAHLLFRSSGQPNLAITGMRAAYPEIRPSLLREGADMQRFPFQAAAAVAGALGTLALILTCIGLFGVVSYVVAHRTKEIGIRMALGAEPLRILAGILADSTRQVCIGIALAIPMSYALGRLASSNILQIQTFDPAVYLLTPLLLLSVTIASCFLPAQRASRVDPMLSLRQD